MTSILLTGPAVEPLSLEEAKTFLRVEHCDDDQVIAALIAGGRMYVETQAHIVLIAQNWRVRFLAAAWAVLPTLPITNIHCRLLNVLLCATSGHSFSTTGIRDRGRRR